MTYRKKLIEVALPLDAINREAARENYIYRGNPSAVHKWWAQRPLAACRAVLFSSLVDDPSSDPVYRKPDGSVDENRAGVKRAQLFNLIEELVKWENSNNDTIINAARAEIARCIASRKLQLGELKKTDKLSGGETVWDLIVKGHGDLDAIRSRHCRLPNPESVNAFLAQHAPPVLDPFCGGGSIPLEAQRLGLRTFASDLNPVPVLITKALIEIPPKFTDQPPVNPGGDRTGGREQERLIKQEWRGTAGLAEDVRHYGKWMRDEAEKRIGHLYPTVTITEAMAEDRPDLKSHVGEELGAIAWLWARTVKCPNPACGMRTPLVRSFCLSKRKGREVFSAPVVLADSHHIHFNVRVGTSARRDNTDKTGARCLHCDHFIKKADLRDIASRFGLDPIPLAIVCEGEDARLYVEARDEWSSMPPAPDVQFLEQLITDDKRWFSPPLYGLPRFSDLFTPRQLVALTTFCDLLADVRTAVAKESGSDEYAVAVVTYLAFAIDKTAEYNCTIVPWFTKEDRPKGLFARQAIPMLWDFAEVNPLATIGGTISRSVEIVADAIEPLGHSVCPGNVRQGDAMHRDTYVPSMVCTDPPYYGNIGYADLSDFFYVWLRRSVGSLFPSMFATLLTPKSDELIASPYRHNGDRGAAERFFEQGLGQAFSMMRSVQVPEFPLTVFYAFKQSEAGDEEEDRESEGLGAIGVSTGWDTMLEGLVASGFGITGTWPMRTERTARSVGQGTNALASSIVLVCHLRASNAPMTTRKDFVGALKKELPAALRDLQSGNIAPVDLAQAAIGPGMAIYSRYSRVVNSDGSRMPVRTALQLINQALDEVLSEQESEFDSETRWAIKWFEQHAQDDGPFGDAETLSKAMAVSARGLAEAGLVKAGAGKVRLLRREELPADWNPATDKRLTIWEVTQHLIRRLETNGETGAAELRRQVGSLGDVARDLAYRLYSTCERKKWADEARSYNGLVVSWPEIERLARERRPAAGETQTTLFDA